MGKTLVPFFLLIASLLPGFAQDQIDAATKQDVEDMMQIRGERDQIPLIYSAMTPQIASEFAARYQQQHPNANPAEVQKATTEAIERFQLVVKAISPDELVEAMIPVYQKYFTHSDIKAINEFYGSPTGQKLVKNTIAMMMDTMQAVQPVVKKHMPEIQAQIQAQMEKTAAAESQPMPSQPASASIRVSAEVSQGLLVKQVPPVYPPLARQARIQGTVVLKAVIATDGTVNSLELVSGHPMLVSAAIDAVKQWRYKPYLVNGVPAEVHTTINVNFLLSSTKQDASQSKVQ